MWKFALVVLIVFASPGWAERAPEERKDATEVIVGTVKHVKAVPKTYETDGEITYYHATVEVEKVEKGDKAKPGEEFKLYWYKITKRPTAKVEGSSSHRCSAAEKDRARFWVKKGSNGWEILFCDDSIEKLKKPE
jgi:hypothetical protein